MANISKIRVGGVDYDIKDQELATEVGKKADSSSLAKVATSGSYNDLSNKPTIPTAVTESTVSGWGFTKNTGTYSKPTTGIPKSDLASAVQTSLGKADTALQSYTERYKGTVTKVKINGSEKSPDSNGLVDLGTIEGSGSSSGPNIVNLEVDTSRYVSVDVDHDNTIYIIGGNYWLNSLNININNTADAFPIGVTVRFEASENMTLTVDSDICWSSTPDFSDGGLYEISFAGSQWNILGVCVNFPEQ